MTQPIHPMLCAMAAKIMEAREGRPCMVKDWAREEQDNPHVAQTLRQARAAIQALLEAETTYDMYDAGDEFVGAHGDAGDADKVFKAMLKPLLGDEG